MKRTILMLAALAFVAAPVLAQSAKTDFSGSWSLNKEKSEIPQGGGGGGGRGMGPAEKLVITQKGNELVVQQGEQKYTLMLDGTASEIPGMRGQPMNVKTKWDGPKLVVEGTATFEGQQGKVTVTRKDTWSLEDGGQTLVLDRVSTTPMGERKVKAVYTKATT